MQPPLSLSYLKSILKYEPATGVWTRIKGSRTKVGYYMPTGYLRIRIKGKRYLAHVLAWFYMTGRWPTKIVDHKDNDARNGRWKNLRLATRTQNRVNCRCRSDSRSGFKGVYQRSDRCWIALIRVRGKLLTLGNFTTPTRAHAAYRIASKKYFGSFARAA